MQKKASTATTAKSATKPAMAAASAKAAAPAKAAALEGEPKVKVEPPAKGPAVKNEPPAKAPGRTRDVPDAPVETPESVAPRQAEGRTKRVAAPVAEGAARGKGPTGGTLSDPPAGQPAKEETVTVAVKKAEATATKRTGGAKPKAVKDDRAAFFAEQRQLLLEERQTYISSAEVLKAQADSLALEHEPGDVQFDEEGGEGGTANVDREIDLYLSAQARATVVEIDRALQKIEDGTYGICERCAEAIPDARLQALPYAALCVTCKSGGLSSRR